MMQKDTVTKILDVAEELFSERGFAETSLRNITTRAGVNLAAVNYHFGSKKELIQAVFARYLTPFCEQLNVELDILLDAAEQETPNLADLLKLLSHTALKAAHGKPKLLAIFMKLLGLAYTQGQGHLRRFLKREYGAVFGRFMEHITKASPDLSAEERFWRIHFMLGATAFTLSGSDALTAMAQHDFGKGIDFVQVLDKLIPFLAAGFNAPQTSFAF